MGTDKGGKKKRKGAGGGVRRSYTRACGGDVKMVLEKGKGLRKGDQEAEMVYGEGL
jgi:hypothetical protein